jgi:hypothetical protein
MTSRAAIDKATPTLRPGTVCKSTSTGQRIRITYLTRGTVDFTNLDTGGNGVLARSYIEKNFSPETTAR